MSAFEFSDAEGGISFGEETPDHRTSPSLSSLPSTQTPALLRMILVDSLSPGHLVEMKIAGGTAITGINGRGKTSMLQLVSLFYGEQGSRIVSATGGKSSFIDYYLPRTTSYIVFEYRCHLGELRQVALHADRQGKKVLYRFIRAGFEPAHYVADGQQLVEAPALARHLKLSGVAFHGELIEHNSEYRAVIQATRTNTGDRARKEILRRMIAEYSLTTPARPIAQIEKLVAGMFRRQTNFEDLQGMVIQCIDETLNERGMEADRKELENWPVAYQAYQDAMAQRAEMDKADLAEQELLAIEGTLRDLRRKFQSLVAHLHGQVGEQQERRSALNAQRETATATYTGAYAAKQQDKAAKQAALDEVRGRIERLKLQHQHYEAEGVEGLASLVDQREALRQHAERLATQQSVLVGEHAQISEQFEKLRHQLDGQYRDALDRLRVEREQVNETSGDILKTAEEAFAVERERIEAKYEVARPELENAVGDAAHALGRAGQLRDHPAEDPELRERFEAKRAVRDQAKNKLHAAETEQHRLERELDGRKRLFDQAEHALGEAKRKADAARVDLERVIKRATPAPGSLLHALQAAHPGWVDDIGKVIRDDLLEREDLSASWEGGDGTCYGLAIDLSKLPPSPLAESMQDAIDAAQAQFADADAKWKAAQQALEDAGKARKKADRDLDAHRAVVAGAKQALQTAEHEFQATEHQVAAARREQRKQAEESVALAQQAHSAAKQRLTQHAERLRAEKTTLDMTHRAKKAEIEQQRQQRLAQIESARAMKERDWRQQHQTINANCDQALREKGVDTTALTRLKNDHDEILEKLRRADGAAGRVMQWRTWKDTEFAHLAGHEASVPPLEHELATLSDQLGMLRSDFDALQEAIEKGIAATVERERQIEIDRSAALKHQQELEAFADSHPVPDYDPAWGLGDLVRQVLEQQKARLERQRTIRASIARIFNAFNRHADSVQAQYLELHKEQVGQDDRKWVPVFKAWFDTLHEKDRSMVLTAAKNLGAEVVSFRKQLHEFDRKVKAFNRQLQDNLDQSVIFESISQVAVDVTSSVTTLPYWNDLEALTADEHIEWLYEMNTLPPQAFADRLGALLGHWEVRSGLRAEFRKLVQICGTVVENGQVRRFRTAADMDNVSSNGLSYLVLVIIFIGFVNRIRAGAAINITWALDELRSISIGNIYHLIELLERNHITLVSAYPDPDPESLELFENWYSVQRDRRLGTPKFTNGDGPSVKAGGDVTDDEREADEFEIPFDAIDG